MSLADENYAAFKCVTSLHRRNIKTNSFNVCSKCDLGSFYQRREDKRLRFPSTGQGGTRSVRRVVDAAAILGFKAFCCPQTLSSQHPKNAFHTVTSLWFFPVDVVPLNGLRHPLSQTRGHHHYMLRTFKRRRLCRSFLPPDRENCLKKRCNF